MFDKLKVLSETLTRTILRQNTHTKARVVRLKITYREDVGGVHEIRRIRINLSDHEGIRHCRNLCREGHEKL